MNNLNIHLSDTEGTRLFELGGSDRKGPFYDAIVRWTKVLLTERGSDLSDPTIGTPLVGLIGTTYVDKATLYDVVYIATDMATQWVKGVQQRESASPEQTITSVDVSSISVDNNYNFTVQYSIKNAAGKTLRMTLPLAD